MVCSKCKSDINSDKEIRIEKSIICNKCLERIIARCHSCYEPIYKDDLIYEASVSWSAEYIVGANETKNIIQCVWCCYQHLRNGNKKEKKLWKWWQKWKKWILGGFIIFCVILLLILGLPLFYPDIVENWNKTSLFKRSVLIILLFIIPILTAYSIISEFDSRYKKRKK